MSGRGVVVAATSSRAGKTTLTLGLVRALRSRLPAVRAAKCGPDYIDAEFHSLASGTPCVNLDGWAMSGDRLASLAAGDGTLVVEGAMGLFDGAYPDGRGSAADVAKRLGLPVVLVVDCASMAHSVAPLVAGFTTHDPDLSVAGIILNRIGSPRHETMVRDALASCPVPVLGAVPRDPRLTRPSRHLGLVQAQEHGDIGRFLDTAAEIVAGHVDLDALMDCTAPLPQPRDAPRVPPLGTHIAIARDAAFSFIYQHILADWQAQGAKTSFFSPLADEVPHPEADAIFLPGGYPELHAQKLTRAGRFRQALRTAAEAGTTIYGECGGYMVLGQAIADARDIAYPMLGLIDLDTSFAQRKLHLGYRNVHTDTGTFRGTYAAHEFHYATVLTSSGTPLFEAKDASGRTVGPLGVVKGSVSGSFAHIIDRRI